MTVATGVATSMTSSPARSASRCTVVWRAALAAAFACCSTALTAQQVFTYTENQSGPGLIPLGYPVPIPVASLTPVDGFRELASLTARLQSLALEHADISAHPVGLSTQGSTVWAYTAASPSSTTPEGFARPAFFIAATTHAREWVAPEVATGLVERIADGTGDQGIVRYLLDHTRLVIIPVLNVDGFAMTQKFPTQAIVGADPCVPNGWPRDGRMRRKNMRGVDTVLTTLGDHLLGIDMNRNHPPFWAVSSQPNSCGNTSSTPVSLVYHGLGAHSEPETQAMRAAAVLGPASRMRLGIDLHSHTSMFLTVNTNRQRLNGIQQRLVSLLSAHHAAVPTRDRAANGVVYGESLGPPAQGIGTASEYFAHEWLVPAWTLEIEPSMTGATQYGGFGVSHDGFILPASQIRRVREAWAETHLIAMYHMAGPPHLARVRIRDAQSGALLQEPRWVARAGGTRELLPQASAALVGGQRVRIELAFSKPMRHRLDGAIAQLPGASVPLAPQVWRRDGSARIALDTVNGRWLAEPGLRYRDDTFVFETTLPGSGTAPQPLALEVEARDMTGHLLDADPATPVDWSAGAWLGWNGSDGSVGDVGGIDARTVAISPVAPEVVVVSASTVVGEGDRIRVRLRRDNPRETRVRVFGESIDMLLSRSSLSPLPPDASFIEWAPGAAGERELVIAVEDDADADGDRKHAQELALVTGDGDAVGFALIEMTVLDNDGGGVVIRDHGTHGRFDSVLAQADTLAGTEFVLDGSSAYTLASAPTVRGQAAVFGNGAGLLPSDSGRLLTIDSGSHLSFDSVRIEQRPMTTESLIRNDGALVLTRASITRHDASGAVLAPAVEGPGNVQLIRTDMQGLLLDISDRAAISGRDVLVESSAIHSIGSVSTVVRTDNGSGLIRWSTLARVAQRELLQAGFGSFLELEGNLLADFGQTPAPVAICGPGVRSLGQNLQQVSPPCAFSATGDRVVAGNVLTPHGPGDLPFPTGAALDHGDGCPAVDLRGAPRPQTMSAGTTARCDAGAIEVGINPYRGLWQPDRDGHGLDLQTNGNRLTVLWYTYNAVGEPTVYQAVAALTGPRWQALLQQARRNVDGTIALSDVGEIRIDFDSNTEATLRWRIDGATERSERMQAALFGGEPRVEITGTWFPPAEPGNGASIVRRGEVTVLVLYYYDAAGALRWMLGTGDADDAVEIQMRSFTGFCPNCNAQAMPVANQIAGRALLHMLTPRRLRIDSDLTYPGAACGRWQRKAARFVPLNDSVDNRDALR